MQIEKNWYRSKRIWITLVTMILVVANDALGLGLPEESVLKVVALALTYVLGQSFEDGKKRAAAALGEAAAKIAETPDPK